MVQKEYVTQAHSRGNSATLNLALRPAQPSPDELRRAAQLIREQFANPAWTNQR
jgi:hypothetical protein